MQGAELISCKSSLTLIALHVSCRRAALGGWVRVWDATDTGEDWNAMRDIVKGGCAGYVQTELCYDCTEQDMMNKHDVPTYSDRSGFGKT